jgi:crotonobetainyl-CoA:carnitine CoA-transferase CaiB-like acyl-CoA transferase
MIARGNWVQTTYPHSGDDELIPGVHWKMGSSKGGFYRPAPLLGGDRDYVLREILSMPEDEVAALEERGVFY